MDYLIEAKKFIQRARQADVAEVTQTDLEMAEWLLSREIEEREHAPTKSVASQTERYPHYLRPLAE
ncbi:MAG: hypothetical protein WBL43_00940 [Pseudolabrys sp.]